MRLEDVTAVIRPRSNWEAADLGFAMVRRDFWRCFSFWWLAMLVPTVVAGCFLWDHPAWWLALFWWWKPAGSRMVLFEISRKLFGERAKWKHVLREIPRVWARGFFHRFLWGRLSPWLPVTLAVSDLEGLRGKEYRQRGKQVTRRGENVVMWLYFVTDLASAWFGLAILMMVQMFVPEGQDGAWRMAAETWSPLAPMDIPALIMRTVVMCMMLAICLTDVFLTGAGFGVYVNNRSAMEGWDVELAFRRMGRRLGGAATLLAALALVLLPVVSRAADAEPVSKAGRVMREVKADPDFTVHTVADRVPKEGSAEMPEWLKNLLEWVFGGSATAWLPTAFAVSAIGLLLGLVGWLVWRNRHVFLLKGDGGGGGPCDAPRARVVMGMEVSPDSLPDDVPGRAWELWREGRKFEALSLLYRGTISRVIEVGRVEIRESDTEGDCVRRVADAGGRAHPDYFKGLTGVWSALAYAGRSPTDEAVESLCREWPFVEGGGA